MLSIDYIVAVDFELTCLEVQPRPSIRKCEIIEFPAVLMNLKTGQIEAEFHKYVKPSEQPILSSFCVNFTGITQQTVDNGIPLQAALASFDAWLRKELAERNLKLGLINNCALVTWSSWDFGAFLPNECERKCLNKKTYFDQWIDIRILFEKFYNRIPKNFKAAQEHVGLTFQGREHSGLADARNLATLAHKMVCNGAKLSINQQYLRGVKRFF